MNGGYEHPHCSYPLVCKNQTIDTFNKIIFGDRDFESTLLYFQEKHKIDELLCILIFIIHWKYIGILVLV